MGAYVDSALLPGEQVVAEARPHWAIFIAPGVVIGFGLLLGKAGAVVVALGIIWAVIQYLVFRTTELALTNKRIISKSGIIRRNVIDVSNSKVEGVTYQQGIVGRILGYGSVSVRGTGVGHVPVPYIAEPEQFKHEVGRVLHS